MKRDDIFKALFPVITGLVWKWLSERNEHNEFERATNDSSRHIRQGASGRINFKGAKQATGANDMKYEYQNGDQMSGFVPGLIIGGIVGGLIGAAAALWFAPQSGEQTQEQVRQEAIKLKQRADETVGDVRSNLETAAEDAREKVDNAREKVSEKVDDARHQGRRFVDEQADKADRTASTLRSDLRNAVADKRR